MSKIIFVAVGAIAICLFQSGGQAAELPMGCSRTALPGDVTGAFFFRCPDGTSYLPENGGGYVRVDRRGKPLAETGMDAGAAEAEPDMQPVEEPAGELAETDMAAPEAEAEMPAETEETSGPKWSAPGGDRAGIEPAATSPEELSEPRFKTVPE